MAEHATIWCRQCDGLNLLEKWQIFMKRWRDFETQKKVCSLHLKRTLLAAEVMPAYGVLHEKESGRRCNAKNPWAENGQELAACVWRKRSEKF